MNAINVEERTLPSIQIAKTDECGEQSLLQVKQRFDVVYFPLMMSVMTVTME